MGISPAMACMEAFMPPFKKHEREGRINEFLSI